MKDKKLRNKQLSKKYKEQIAEAMSIELEYYGWECKLKEDSNKICDSCLTSSKYDCHYCWNCGFKLKETIEEYNSDSVHALYEAFLLGLQEYLTIYEVLR